MLARFDATDELLTVWDSTQMPHKTKRVLVEALGLSEERVRVIAPDVGGGFGPKNPFYPEELAVPAAALLLGRPIKWIEDRRECFTATNHEREQDWEIEAAVDRDGRLLAIRGHLRHDHGATHAVRPFAAAEFGHQSHRPLRPAGVSARGLALPHQSGGGDVDARRRPHAGHLRDGAHARSHRRRAWPRPRRGAPAQSHHAAADALRHAGHDPRRPADDLRQRRLSRVPAPRAGGGRLDGFPGAPRGRAQRGALARHRPRQLRRRHRARPVRKRRRPHRTIRKDIRHDRRGRAGTGNTHHAGAARRRRARRRARSRSTSPTATPRPVRSGSAPMPAGRP